jgi:cytochrome P450
VLGTITLLGHRDVYERLARRDAPNFVASVVDEPMRYLSIVQAEVERVATEDLTLGGERVSCWRLSGTASSWPSRKSSRSIERVAAT